MTAKLNRAKEITKRLNALEDEAAALRAEQELLESEFAKLVGDDDADDDEAEEDQEATPSPPLPPQAPRVFEPPGRRRTRLGAPNRILQLMSLEPEHLFSPNEITHRVNKSPNYPPIDAKVVRNTLLRLSKNGGPIFKNPQTRGLYQMRRQN
jgi:hypothetical protein